MNLRPAWRALFGSLLLATAGCGASTPATTQRAQPFTTPTQMPATETTAAQMTQGPAEPSYVHGKRCGDVAAGDVTRYGLFIPSSAAQITCEEALTVVRRYLQSNMSNGAIIVGSNSWFCRDAEHDCTAGKNGLIKFADDY